MATSDESPSTQGTVLREATLTRDTLVPIGVSIAVMTAFVSGAIWLNSTLQRIDFALTEIRRDLRSVSERIDVSVNRSAFTQWIQLLQAQNQDLDVPNFK